MLRIDSATASWERARIATGLRRSLVEETRLAEAGVTLYADDFEREELEEARRLEEVTRLLEEKAGGLMPEERGIDPSLLFVIRDEEGAKKRATCPPSMVLLTTTGNTSHVRSRSVGTRRTPRQERQMVTATPSIARIMSRSLRRSFASERAESCSREVFAPVDTLRDWSIKTSSYMQNHSQRG